MMIEEILFSLPERTQLLAGPMFITHRDWVAFAHLRPGKDGSYLEVHIPEPHVGGKPLIIVVDEVEYTVHFDSWHGHFDTWAETVEEQEPGDAREFIDLFMREHLAISVTKQGDKFIKSQTVRTDRDSILESSPWYHGAMGVTGIGHDPKLSDVPVRTYIRSWRGTFDRDQSEP